MNPVIPPRPDVSYVGVTTKPPITSKSPPGMDYTGERHHSRRRDPPPVPPREPSDNDWEEREEMWSRELEEVKARAAQMEKTMRWWSDCTANWREKWSKVRNERNKAREECRQLRAKLESSVKEATQLKREKQELCVEMEALRKQTDIYHNEKDKASVASSTGSHRSGGSEHDNITSENLPEKDSELSLSSHSIPHSDQTFVDKLLSKKDKDSETSSGYHDKGSDRQKSRKKEDTVKHVKDQDVINELAATNQKLTALDMKLNEAQKTLLLERQEKNGLSQNLEKAENDLIALRAKYEELKRSKEDVVEQLNTLREQHNDELGRVTMELEDESYSRSTMDKRLADLRKELERLQAENAQEWGKRERLETEKLALERENKKLKNEIENLEEELERKGRQATSLLDSDIKNLQQDVSERAKELNDLKHSHLKLKKVLQEKTIELEHAQRRSEQYEMEVKKLRGRIEDLKQDLANAEDEVDQQTNLCRRLQRTNDELTEQNETLKVQVDHLSTRLKRSTSQTMLSKRTSSLKNFDDANDSTTDGPTEDEDEDDID